MAVKAVILFCVLCLPVWADLAAGVRALKNRDYATALREFSLLAEHGNTDAQVNLGGMYNDGLGVPQNYNEAMRWW